MSRLLAVVICLGGCVGGGQLGSSLPPPTYQYDYTQTSYDPYAASPAQPAAPEASGGSYYAEAGASMQADEDGVTMAFTATEQDRRVAVDSRSTVIINGKTVADDHTSYRGDSREALRDRPPHHTVALVHDDDEGPADHESERGRDRREQFDDCVDWSFAEYRKTYTVGDARNAAHRNCELVGDLDVAKLLYGTYARSLNSADALNAALPTATEELGRKYKVLKIALDGYTKGGYTGQDAAHHAVRMADTVKRKAWRCLKREFDALYPEYTGYDAMNQAFARCK